MELAARTDVAQVEEALADNGLSVRHRLKLTHPLLLWFLSCEGKSSGRGGWMWRR